MMTLPQNLVLLVFPIVMVASAITDLTTMTISNRLSAALALAFPVAALMLGMPLETVGMHVLAGLSVLAFGIFFFSRGWIGGGDAKLMAAAALWFGFADLLPFLVFAAIFGGLLTGLILAFRSWTPPAFALRPVWVSRLHDRTVGVPYGIAIAAGGLAVFQQTPFMAFIS